MLRRTPWRILDSARAETGETITVDASSSSVHRALDDPIAPSAVRGLRRHRDDELVVLAFAGPQRGEPTIKRRDQAIQISLFGFEFANLGPQPRHRPEPDNLFAFHTGSQPHTASGEVNGDLFQLVSENIPEVRRLRGVRRASCADHPLPNSHCGNLTVPLGGCHPGHRFFSGWRGPHMVYAGEAADRIFIVVKFETKPGWTERPARTGSAVHRGHRAEGHQPDGRRQRRVQAGRDHRGLSVYGTTAISLPSRYPGASGSASPLQKRPGSNQLVSLSVTSKPISS
ncbi:MAG: hypothetical protein JWR48_477 [Mycobacterium sp.]|jgi:hypothetical protein|nr:hypothetical protein [Mycobacterium sp.]